MQLRARRAATRANLSHTLRLTAAAVVVASTALWDLAAAPQSTRPVSSRDLVSRADAARLREKVAGIERLGLTASPATPAPRPAGRSTVVTEREVNSYLAYDAGSQIPAGITGPRVNILDGQRLAATALVDLDAVRARHKSTGWFDPMNLLTGRVPVSVSGRLLSSDGVARFDLESATVSNIPIPKTLVQELVSHYSRTPQNPRGLNLDDSFQLPARIRQIDVRRGEAVVIQ